MDNIILYYYVVFIYIVMILNSKITLFYDHKDFFLINVIFCQALEKNPKLSFQWYTF